MTDRVPIIGIVPTYVPEEDVLRLAAGLTCSIKSAVDVVIREGSSEWHNSNTSTTN